ncbi:MAG: hypothetical protein AABZ30_01965 [Myxococcota bacterium]
MPPEVLARVLYLKGRDVRRAFAKMVASEYPLATTAGVTVEVARHVRDDLPKLNTPDFWRSAQAVYRQMGMQEELVRLLDGGVKRIPNVGIVDDSLIVVCCRLGLQLVTGDRRGLVERAQHAGVKVLHVTELVALYA